jgi:hypothetical protein
LLLEGKRQAILQRRGLFDFVSPFIVFLAALGYFLFIAFVICIQHLGYQSETTGCSGAAHPLPRPRPTALDCRRLTSTSGESDPNHFEPNFRALACKVACRLKLSPTPYRGFESLPLGSCPHPSRFVLPSFAFRRKLNSPRATKSQAGCSLVS